MARKPPPDVPLPSPRAKGVKVDFVLTDEITPTAQMVVDSIRSGTPRCGSGCYFPDLPDDPAGSKTVRCILPEGHLGDHQSKRRTWNYERAEPAPSAEELARFDAALGWEPE